MIQHSLNGLGSQAIFNEYNLNIGTTEYRDSLLILALALPHMNPRLGKGFEDSVKTCKFQPGVWWCRPVNPAVCEFEANLGYMRTHLKTTIIHKK